MAKIALVIGALLIAVGVVAWLLSGGPEASPTSLIPAVIGALIAGAGVVAGRGGAARRHAMHAAAALALLGALGSVGQLAVRPTEGSENAGIAMVAGLLNLGLCAAFLLLAVRSFVAARRGAGSF